MDDLADELGISVKALRLRCEMLGLMRLRNEADRLAQSERFDAGMTSTDLVNGVPVSMAHLVAAGRSVLPEGPQFWGCISGYA